MRYATVCSGIEAPSVAWHPLGWTPVFFSEIEAFPSAVLAHHYPQVPNRGDMNTFREWPLESVDLICAGTPCQSFSVAGLRKGLDDPRGNLTLVYLAILDRFRPRWMVWENVPGVLSDGTGAFGSFLGGLGQLGYGFAYRVLDAQHFGVPQRRRRVFVVGCLGNWRAAAAVLFERHSLQGNPAPSREARERVAASSARSVAIRGRDGTPQAELGDDKANAILTPNGGRGGIGVGAVLAPDVSDTLRQHTRPGSNSVGTVLAAYGGNNTSGAIDVATACNAHGGSGRMDFESETLVAHSLRADGFDASEDGTGRGTPIVPVAFTQNQREEVREMEVAGRLPAIRRGDAKNETLLAFSAKDHGGDASDIAPTLRAGGHTDSHANAGVMPAVAFYPTNRQPEFGNYEDVSPAVKVGTSGTGGNPPAVAYGLDSQLNGESEAIGPLTIGSATGGGQPARTAIFSGERNADAEETGPIQMLRALRDCVDEETLCKWGLGIIAAFWPQEVLRSEVHGSGVRYSTQPKRGLVNVALSRSQTGAAWSMQDLWQAGCDGCPSQGWRPHEQLARELGAYLSRLPHAPSPAERFLRAMWEASEGSRLLREALSAVQKARRSTCGEAQPIRGGMQVRRLSVEECEALQGFPRGYTLITYRGKPAADGPRYKALGNSMAVPVVRWIGERIQMVEELFA
jgi:DNA (cytosine-5)-methyltransferase 1